MFDTPEKWDEGFRHLQGDLETLFKLVFTFRKAVSEADVRVASVTLRKWLIEGLLAQLCKVRRQKLTFPVLDNDKLLLDIVGEPSINYFLTGGIRFNGQPIQCIYHSSLPAGEKPLLRPQPMPDCMVRLSDFVHQKRLFFEGTFFTCADIIKYTANKLGGAHLDERRTEHFAKLDAAAAFMKFGGPPDFSKPPPSEIYMMVEPEGSEVLTAVHIEIIAAATSFIQVHLDGEPVMKLTILKPWLNRLRAVFDRSQPGFRMYEFGKSNRT